MKLEVDVTIEDIKAAEYQAGVYHKCPISQALMRLGCTQIDVDEPRMLFTKDGVRWFYKTPRSANLFINEFDNSETITGFKPFKFDLVDGRQALPEDERKPYGHKPEDDVPIDYIGYNELEAEELDAQDIEEINRDRVCRCKHTHSRHKDGAIVGLGYACIEENCTCNNFSWGLLR